MVAAHVAVRCLSEIRRGLMEVTREMLERYRSNAAEIKEQRERLQHLTDNEALVGNDTVFDYHTGYPRPQSVIGFDYGEKRKKRIENKISVLSAENDNIEEFVFGQTDHTVRRILQLHYLDECSQQRVARRMHMHQSTVSRILDNFFKKNEES